MSTKNSNNDITTSNASITKKVVKKVIKKKSPVEKIEDEIASSKSVTNSKTSIAGSNLNITSSNLNIKNSIDSVSNSNSKIDEVVIDTKACHISSMKIEEIETILGEKERIMGELYVAELKIDRLEDENRNLKDIIEEQKTTISKLLVNNNNGEIDVENNNNSESSHNINDDNNYNEISVNNENIDKEKLLKKIEVLEINNEHLKGQNEELLGVIQNSEEEIERLQEELRSFKTSSKVELSKVKIENNKLKSSLEEMEDKTKSIENIEKENDELRSSLENIEDKDKAIEELAKENTVLKSSLQSLHDENVKKSKENKELKDTISEIVDEIKTIKEPESKPEVLNEQNPIGSNGSINKPIQKDITVMSTESLLKCAVPDLVNEIKDLKKCVYHINKQKKEVEKKLQDTLQRNMCAKYDLMDASLTNTSSLEELQNIIDSMDKELMNTKKIKAQFDEQENTIIDLKKELLKYGNRKGCSGRFPSQSKQYIDERGMEGLKIKSQLQYEKNQLQVQLNSARSTIHQLKKLCDNLTNELENVRSNSVKDHSSLDGSNNYVNGYSISIANTNGGNNCGHNRSLAYPHRHSTNSYSNASTSKSMSSGNCNTSDLLRERKKETRLNQDLCGLQNKFQDLLKSYQAIKNERDTLSDELVNLSPNSRTKNNDQAASSSSSKGYYKGKDHGSKTSGRQHLRSCSTHTNGIKVEVFA